MLQGLVDTNTKALQQRISVNQNSKHNLEDWIIQHLDLRDGMKIMDLGCGTGKQIKAIRKVFQGDIIGIDVSLEALNFADESTTLICGNFDQSIVQGKFDRILSTYAIYYSKDINQTIKRYVEMLKKDGIMFLVGFAKGSNKELYDIINQVIKENNLDYELRESFDFMTPPNDSTVIRFQNEIYFESKERIIQWWENHNSYIEEIRDDVIERFPNKITLSKNTMGVIVKGAE